MLSVRDKAKDNLQSMLPTHYFTDSLNSFGREETQSDLVVWLSSLSNDDLTDLQYKLQTFINAMPWGISVEDGFDLIFLSFEAESIKRGKRIVNLSSEKREKVLCEILAWTRAEIEKRQIPARKANGNHDRQ